MSVASVAAYWHFIPFHFNHAIIFDVLCIFAINTLGHVTCAGLIAMYFVLSVRCFIFEILHEIKKTNMLRLKKTIAAFFLCVPCFRDCERVSMKFKARCITLTEMNIDDEKCTSCKN